MKYTYIDAEAEKEMLRQRLTGLEREHFTQMTNLRLLHEDNSEQAAVLIKQTSDTIEGLERAYTTVKELLASYDEVPAGRANGRATKK